MKTLIIISILFSSIFSFSQNLRTPEDVKQFNREFIRLINIERKKLNIDTLIESEKLTKASIDWSRECITKIFFKHSSKLTVAECLTYIFGKKPVNRSVTQSISSFKGSEQHWAILMDPSYKYIGVGEYQNSTINPYANQYENASKYYISSVVTIQIWK